MHASCLCVIARRGTGTSSLMMLHPFLPPFMQRLEGLDMQLCHFMWQWQCKLYQCFGNIMQVIVVTDDIMIVGKKPNHSNHDKALTTLLETARRCNVWLNYEQLQYKKQDIGFLVKFTLQAVTSLIRIKLQQSPWCLHQQTINKYNPLLEWSITCPSFQLDCPRLQSPSGNWQRTRYLATGAQNTDPPLHRWKKRLQVLPYWLTSIQRSKLCLGACLLQDEKPVYIASKALMDAQ